MRRLLLGTAWLLTASIACAQSPKDITKPTAWFGVQLPPALGAEPAVIVGSRDPRPAIFPAGTPMYPELEGAAIKKDVETIVGFSKTSRTSHEFGSGQLWGRVSGFPSSARTIEWAAAQLRSAGIADTKLQPIEQESRAPFWIPLSWELRLLGDTKFGVGSSDLILESAMPLTNSEIAGGTLTAPLVYVGSANPSVVEHIDVKGKIAVQLIVPQGHMVFERGIARSRAQDLFKRGAVAVLNLVRLPGNERSNDFGNCGGTCFNIGGRDGQFLEAVLDRAVQSGANNIVRAQLSLKSETHTNLKAENAVAVIKGRKSDEVVIIDTHADAWFDGAGDNADGLAVTLALARHFAKPKNKPDRTLVFIVSAGHHSPGLNGVRNFISANPDLAKQTVLVVNVEHVAQRNFSAARSTASDGYRQFVADTGEAPIVFGVTNGAPLIDTFASEGVTRFGVNLVSEKSTMQSGETGGFADLKVAKITVMQAPPLYHTTGETIDVISTPGLERMARFLTYFVEEVAKAPQNKLNPAGG